MEQASETPLKKTPLNARHRASGARMVPFAGWDMPVEYSGISAEHMAVRERAGLFDVSHMGQIEIAGANALDAVQRISCNDASRLQVGQAQYSGLLTPQGTFVDDLLVYRLAPQHFLLVVNASHIDKDYAYIAAGVRCTISRTGYTGEDGFEIFVPPQSADRVWLALLQAGEPHGLIPCGLGARDTLRLEAAMRLHGNDIDETTTVLEADLGWIVGWKKETFIGSDVLRRQKIEGVRRKIVGFELRDRGIARHGHDIYAGDL